MRTACFTLAAVALVNVAIAEVVAIAEGPPADDAGYVALFDGRDLSGWKKVGGDATYRVEGDCIVGESGPGPNTFLRTEKTYRDFVFRVDVKLDEPSNSGIQFRSHQKPDKKTGEATGTVFGYQMEVDPSERKWSGGIYDESRRGWLFDLKNKPEAQRAFKVADWNEYVIEAKGNRLRTWVNGVPVADLTDDADAEGFIALQVHSVKAPQKGKIRWRNIRIKELGEEQAGDATEPE